MIQILDPHNIKRIRNENPLIHGAKKVVEEKQSKTPYALLNERKQRQKP